MRKSLSVLKQVATSVLHILHPVCKNPGNRFEMVVALKYLSSFSFSVHTTLHLELKLEKKLIKDEIKQIVQVVYSDIQCI